jgi:hypothetical protein
MRRPLSAAGRRRPRATGTAQAQIRESRAESVNSGVEELTPHSPSRIRADRIATPQATKRYPYAGQIGPHHLLSETSPNPKVAQFDSLAKGFNGIITKL